MRNNNNIPILHVGYPKTATTWLQKEFFPKIPDIELYNHKRILKTIGSEWKKIENTEDIHDALRISNKRLVISDESMIGGFKWMEHNVRNYKEIFYPAHIIIFIRNQFDIHISNYSQYIKLGGTAKFADFVFTPSKEIRAGKKHCYHYLISLYKKHFGDSNVYVYLYEEFRENQVNFITKFAANHELNLESFHSKYKKVNTGLSDKLLKIKRVSNYFTKHHPYRIGTNFSNHERYLFHIPYWHEFSLLGFGFLNKIVRQNNAIVSERFTQKEDVKIIKNYFRASNHRLILDHGLERIRDFHYPL